MCSGRIAPGNNTVASGKIGSFSMRSVTSNSMSGIIAPAARAAKKRLSGEYLIERRVDVVQADRLGDDLIHNLAMARDGFRRHGIAGHHDDLHRRPAQANLS